MAQTRGVIEGLYESLITQELAARLAAHGDLVPDEHGVDDADQPEVYARHIRDAVRRALAAERDPDRRVALANRLLAVLDDPDAEIVRPRQLLSAVRPAGPGRLPFDTRRPATPLSDAPCSPTPPVSRASAPRCAPSWPAPTASTRSSPSSSGTGYGSSRPSCSCWPTAGFRCASSRRPTWAPPSGRRSTGWSATSARRSRSSTTRAHPPARQGLAVPPRHRLRHRVRRVVQPLARRAPRRGRVERAALPVATPALLEKFSRHLRELLGRPDLRALRPRPRRRPPRRRAGASAGSSPHGPRHDLPCRVSR